MEKIAKYALLNDLYGSLLTKKQQEFLDLFYNQDLSLTEIGELMGITRQGVYDSLQRSEKALNHYEESLGLFHKMEQEAMVIAWLEKALKDKNWELVETARNILKDN